MSADTQALLANGRALEQQSQQLTGQLVRAPYGNAALYSALAAAAAFYRDQASHSWVPDYLAGRGLDHLTGGQDPAGYAPKSWTALTTHLRGHGYDDATLLAAGLAAHSSRQPGQIYDRFRDRLMLPITTSDGAVVSFVGRAAPSSAAEQAAKYLNGPTTALYRKSDMPYGLRGGAAARLKAGATLVLVEGPLDAEAVTALGDPRLVGVAATGTALTPGHLRTLDAIAPLGERLVVCGFDNDANSAGQNAALKANQLLIDAGVPSPHTLDLPDGSDPAQFLGQQGRVGLADALAHSRPLLDVVVDDALRRALPADFAQLVDADTRRHHAWHAARAVIETCVIPDDSLARSPAAISRQVIRITEMLPELDLPAVFDIVGHRMLGDTWDNATDQLVAMPPVHTGAVVSAARAYSQPAQGFNGQPKSR